MPKSAERPRDPSRENRKSGEDASSRKESGRTSRRLRVLVVRHAIAEEQADFAKTRQPDAQRPLTKEGRRRMKRAASGLARLVPRLNVLATSPLTRAVETADILAEQFGGMRTATLAALAPGKPAGALLSWLADQRPGVTVAVVGHEPDLGQFISWAMTGLRDSFVPLKKGAACMIEFQNEIKPGRARLLWLLKPSQLRGIK